MDQQRIGSFLKKLRKEKNLTQEQLAEQFCFSFAYLTGLHAKRSPHRIFSAVRGIFL